jgi:hypothetical protein
MKQSSLDMSHALTALALMLSVFTLTGMVTASLVVTGNLAPRNLQNTDFTPP